MTKNFFTIGDDFAGIITAAMPTADFACAKQIASGWTNIVFNVPACGAEYIFRFPRNGFWSRAIEKDVAFSRFIRPHVSVKTPDMKLMRDAQGRPFSAHEKLPGNCLTDAMCGLSMEQKKNTVDGIAKYLAELADIPVESLPPDCNQKESEFLDILAKVYEKYQSFDNSLTGRIEDCVVHGDLNPGNILVDSDGRVIGIIDHAFAGRAHEIFDLSNLISRCPRDWKDALVAAYEDATGKIVDMPVLDEFINCRRRIEAGYIKYMKAEMPEIILPSGL